MSKPLAYLPGIDVLRALAVLAVILYHCCPAWLPGGFTGVDLFFVISGYVVSGSLARDCQRTSGFTALAIAFYARRVRRIYPALSVCLLVSAFFQVLLVPRSWLSMAADNTGLAAFFGISNLVLVWLNNSYFSPQGDFNLFTHTWSLAVEEQFYLLFPPLFFFWWRLRAQSGIRRWFAWGMLPVLFALSLCWAWQETVGNPARAYYLLPSRFWELAAGSILFMLHQRGLLLARSGSWVSGCLLGGALLLLVGFVRCDAKAFPFPWAIAPVAAALLLIAGIRAGNEHAIVPCRFPGYQCLRYIGKLSYSLYLWHWPVLVLFRWTVGLEQPLASGLALLITLLLAMLSYHFIERPRQRERDFVRESARRRLASGLLLLAVFAASTFILFRLQPYISRSVTRDVANWYPYPELYPADEAGLPAVSQRRWQGHQLFVLGDSHVYGYNRLLALLAHREGVVVRKFSREGCPVANLLWRKSPDCAGFIERSLAQIRQESRPGDVVFLASLRTTRLSNSWDTAPLDLSAILQAQNDPGTLQHRQIAVDEADGIISALEQASLTVVIDAPKPVMLSPPFRCADWFNAGNPVCAAGLQVSRDILLQHRAQTMQSLRALSRRHPDLLVWDPFPVLCPGTVCRAFDGDLPLFFDGDHLSGHGNRLLYPSFYNLLVRAWQGRGRQHLPATD